MSKVLDIPVTVRDLNGNHVCADGPVPILRRTISGHLFQPRNEVVKASELVVPLLVRSDEIITLRHASVHEVEVVRAAKKKGDSAAKQRVRFETLIAEESSQASKGTSSTLCRGGLVVEVVNAHDCRHEEGGHRCMTKDLLEFDWPDSVIFRGVDDTVRARPKHSSDLGNEPDDIWAQIAREQ